MGSRRLCALFAVQLVHAAPPRSRLSIESYGDSFADSGSAMNISAPAMPANRMINTCSDGCDYRHGRCEDGMCVCNVQPWCGRLCNRMCQNGGTCKSPPGECQCLAGWAGSMCEKPVTTKASDYINQKVPPKAPPPVTKDRPVKARVLSVDGFGENAELEDIFKCDKYKSTKEVGLPADIPMENIVGIQVRCENAELKTIQFGNMDPMAGFRHWGHSERCQDQFDVIPDESVPASFRQAAMILKRNSDVDYRYEVRDGQLILYQIGNAKKLGLCKMKVSIMYH